MRNFGLVAVKLHRSTPIGAGGHQASRFARVVTLVSEADLERDLDMVRAVEAGSAEGIFDPASITWRIDREAAIFLGAGRALLLQLAHPWVAAAIAEHSRTSLTRWAGSTGPSTCHVHDGVRHAGSSAVRVPPAASASRDDQRRPTKRRRPVAAVLPVRQTRSRRCAGSTPRSWKLLW